MPSNRAGEAGPRLAALVSGKRKTRRFPSISATTGTLRCMGERDRPDRV